MEESLVGFNVAQLAKLKKFDLECLYFFQVDGRMQEYSFRIDANKSGFGYGETISRPSQSLLSKWLREEHGIFIGIDIYCPESPGNFYFLPKIDFQRGHEKLYTSFSRDFEGVQQEKVENREGYWTGKDGSYELAIEDALTEALKLIK